MLALLLSQFLLLMLFLNTAFGDPISKIDKKKSDVTTVIAQMSSAINSRKPLNIKAFFEYYASSDAKFEIKSHLVSNGKEESVSKDSTQILNRQEYIDMLSQIVKNTTVYGFEANMESFTPEGDGFAIAEVRIKEVAANFAYNNRKNNNRVLKRVKIDTNCNFMFNILASTPIIMSSNCIEEIVLEQP